MDGKTEKEYTIEDFKILIQSHWGNIRNEEKVMSGIEKSFRHLIGKELKELWIFIKEKSGDMKSPSATGILKLAKDHSFRIRKSEVNKIESRFVCGACSKECGILERTCTDCGKQLSDLPKKCVCGYVFPDDFGYGYCPNMLKSGKGEKRCNVYRGPGGVKRVVV